MLVSIDNNNVQCFYVECLFAGRIYVYLFTYIYLQAFFSLICGTHWQMVHSIFLTSNKMTQIKKCADFVKSFEVIRIH